MEQTRVFEERLRPRDHLTSLAFELPRILKAIDRIRQDVCSSSPTSETTCSLLEDIHHRLRANFESWLEEVKKSIGGNLFWPSSHTKIFGEQPIDPECSPKHKSSLQQLVFANETTAGLLVHYWAFQLELITAQDDLQ